MDSNFFTFERAMQADAAAFLKRSVRKLMLDVLLDRITHAEIVAAGAFRFRTEFVKDIGAVFGAHKNKADELANRVFAFFRVQWAEKYPGVTPEMFLNRVAPVSPPTPAEVEAAWELEIGSSDAAMRSLYEGSARIRKGDDLGVRSNPPATKH